MYYAIMMRCITIRTLALMGFSTEHSLGALQATGGDVEAAVLLLLASAATGEGLLPPPVGAAGGAGGGAAAESGADKAEP